MESDGCFTSIEELLIHDLFRNIDLREMRCAAVTVRLLIFSNFLFSPCRNLMRLFQVFRPTLTPSIMSLLDGIKRQDLGKGCVQFQCNVLNHEICKNLFARVYINSARK